MDHAFDTLVALRAAAAADSPEVERRLLDVFLTALDRELRASAERLFGDLADDVIQLTLLDLAKRWGRCTATTPGALRGWVRRIARSRHIDLRRKWFPDPMDPEDLPAILVADEGPSERSLGEAIEQAVVAAEDAVLSLTDLPPADRAWARERRVSPDPARQSRDARVFIEVKLRNRPGPEVADEVDVPRTHLAKHLERGRATFALIAARLTEEAPDPVIRDALATVARAAGRRTKGDV